MSSDQPLPPPGKERLAELVRRHRAERDQRRAEDGDRAETLEEFGQRVFGDEVGQKVLIEWLRENAPWTLSGTGEDVDSPNGR